MKRALTILNETGDVTITWDADADEKMLPIIEAKLKAGIVFFLIEPRMGGLVAPDTSKQLKKAKDSLKHRALSMKDKDFEEMVVTGNAVVIQTPAAPARTVRKAKTAREVVAAESVGVRQMRGG